MSTSADIRPFSGTKTPGCFACDHAGQQVEIEYDADLALCTVHWNWWLTTYLPSPGRVTPEPPCAAHLLGVTR